MVQFKNTPAKPDSFEESRKRIHEMAQQGQFVMPGEEHGSSRSAEETFGVREAAGEAALEKLAAQVPPEVVSEKGSSSPEATDEAKSRTLETRTKPSTPSRALALEPGSGESAAPERELSAVEKLKLPLKETEIQAGLKAPLDQSLRWLATWCQRQISKLSPGQFKGRERVSLGMITLEVCLPKDNEIEIAAAEQMFAAFYNLQSGGLTGPTQVLCLEILGEKDSIRFLVTVPADWVDFVEKQIHGAYPEADIEPVTEPQIFTQEGSVAYAQLRRTGAPYYPIRTYEDLKSDAMSQITSALSKLEEGEVVAWQLLITPAGDKWRRQGERFVSSAQQEPLEKDKFKANIKVDPKLIEAAQKKIGKVGFDTTLRLVAVAKDKIAAPSHLRNLAGAFEQFGLPHLGSFKQASTRFRKSFATDFVYCYFPGFLAKSSGVLNIEELATIFHFPNQEVKTPHINWLDARKSAPPQDVSQEGLYLGISAYRGVDKKIFMREDDRRRHMYVLGQTGTGKSEFLKFMAQQDIREGRGLAFIDPHGEAIEDLLQQVPKDRAEDVIYFDPGHSDRPMGLNILEAPTEEGKHMAINSFIALLYKLYDPGRTGIMGPMLERAIRNVMLTAMEEEGNTLIEVMRLLTDPNYAKEKTAIIKDPMVKRFWTDQMAQTSDFHKSEQLGYFVSKFDRFVTEKLMRNIIGQGKSAFNFRQVMDQQKILLVNLSKGKIGEENSNFLGLILVPRLLIAAMSRVDLPEEERKDFYLYVDEFQNFATPDFVQILSEARKYRLSLIVGNQFIGQLDEKIKDAVFGNVGSTIIFRVGTDDAAYLEKYFDPVFGQQDIMSNPVGSAYAKLLIRNKPSEPFSMKTDWSGIQDLPRDPKMAATLKELSYLKYGRDRSVVENEIKLRARLD